MAILTARSYCWKKIVCFSSEFFIMNNFIGVLPMKKKWITVASIVLLAGVFAAVAFAGSPVKLIVDGQ